MHAFPCEKSGEDGGSSLSDPAGLRTQQGGPISSHAGAPPRAGSSDLPASEPLQGLLKQSPIHLRLSGSGVGPGSLHL